MARQSPPKYQQVADDLRARMESGEYPPGSALPAKPKLMDHYGVAQHTIDHAIDILREAGLADPQQGKGVFVLAPPPPQPSQFDVVMARMDGLDETVRRLEEQMRELQAQLPANPPAGTDPTRGG